MPNLFFIWGGELVPTPASFGTLSPLCAPRVANPRREGEGMGASSHPIIPFPDDSILEDCRFVDQYHLHFSKELLLYLLSTKMKPVLPEP